MSVLVETFQSHLDGGPGSWNNSVADNFTPESQTRWRVSRLLRNVSLTFDRDDSNHLGGRMIRCEEYE